ncbi:MAG: glycosyltransferase family 4 protein [Rhodocyclaceae bacterium]|nr:glycosyltransferase family 4 protein [Rhodocyclaceae bacterium]
MRIALLNSFYYPTEPGGAERSVRLLAEELARQGHEVSVVCLADAARSERIGGVMVERLPIRNLYLPDANAGRPDAARRLLWHALDSWNPLAVAGLGRILDRLRPEILHTNNLAGFSVSAWRAASSRGITVVHTTRDFYLMCPSTTMMRGGRSCQRPCASCQPFAWARRAASCGVDRVVGISRFILERHLANGYFADVPSSVIYNPFETREQRPRSPGPVIRLGYIGRLVPTKGLSELMQAVTELRAAGLDLELRVAGRGRPDFVSALRAAHADLPVEFLGEVAPASFFDQVDVTVVPSQWDEPLGRVVIESLAFGRPVVASPVGGIPELAVDPCVLLAASPSPESLGMAIAEMVRRVRADTPSLAAACLSAASVYALAPVASQYAGVFEAAMGRATEAWAG